MNPHANVPYLCKPFFGLTPLLWGSGYLHLYDPPLRPSNILYSLNFPSIPRIIEIISGLLQRYGTAVRVQGKTPPWTTIVVV